MNAKPPCRGATALDSCHSVEAVEAMTSGSHSTTTFRFVRDAAETCPVCGHIRARRTRPEGERDTIGYVPNYSAFVQQAPSPADARSLADYKLVSR